MLDEEVDRGGGGGDGGQRRAHVAGVAQQSIKKNKQKSNKLYGKEVQVPFPVGDPCEDGLRRDGPPGVVAHAVQAQPHAAHAQMKRKL